MKHKKSVIAYIATGAFLLFGLACIVLGFGLADGWEKIIGWFTSKYAIYVYVFAFFYLCGVAYLLIWGKINGKR